MFWELGQYREKVNRKGELTETECRSAVEATILLSWRNQ